MQYAPLVVFALLGVVAATVVSFRKGRPVCGWFGVMALVLPLIVVGILAVATYQESRVDYNDGAAATGGGMTIALGWIVGMMVTIPIATALAIVAVVGALRLARPASRWAEQQLDQPNPPLEARSGRLPPPL